MLKMAFRVKEQNSMGSKLCFDMQFAMEAKNNVD